MVEPLKPEKSLRKIVRPPPLVSNGQRRRLLVVLPPLLRACLYQCETARHSLERLGNRSLPFLLQHSVGSRWGIRDYR